MLISQRTSNQEFAPTAQLKLTGKKGNYIKGVLKKKVADKTYPKKFNYFITVQDLEGDTVLWNKELQAEQTKDVQVGEDVFIKGFTGLQIGLNDVTEGTYVEIEYQGTGKAKKGQRAPYLVDVKAEK